MLIIINPSAAKARSTWPIIQTQLDSAGIGYETYDTTSPGDATNKTRAALKSGVESVVIVGGDGTLSEAAEGFFELNEDLDTPPAPINPSATLAILPAGTGDDFARGLRRKRVPLHEWIQTLIEHNAQTIDVLYGR